MPTYSTYTHGGGTCDAVCHYQCCSNLFAIYIDSWWSRRNYHVDELVVGRLRVGAETAVHLRRLHAVGRRAIRLRRPLRRCHRAVVVIVIVIITPD